VLLPRRHALLGGATGAGKSGELNELLANLAACGDVVIWAIDLKGGMELRLWAPCIDRLATTSAQAVGLLADAVTILHARAQWLADHGMRHWRPSPDMPALVIIIDEYAKLAEESADSMGDTDTIARRGRAPAVTLVAATQRPTQKVMGQGAVRSQMNIRIAFRVQEQRDVDLILGQGMLRAGWHAHKLNAPGKFLVSAPEHDTPQRARAYLITDDDVKNAVARYAATRPQLDAISRLALTPPPPAPTAGMMQPDEPDNGDADPHEPSDERQGSDDALWLALCVAPDEDYDIAELIRLTGMSRPTLYRRLREHADEGRAIQVSRGRWRAPASRTNRHRE
jgi:DNA segregation ATPase FtsK/SpoIIIE-like protein